MPRSVRVQVPAKLNLSLSVGPRREDGYHPLATVYQAVSLFDVVDVTDRDDGGRIELAVAGRESPGVPTGRTNLAWLAATAVAETFGRSPALSITIDKQIPAAGGMAGGSADAAAVLHACATLWAEDKAGLDLMAVAARIGSDVPFGLLGGTAVGTGRGEFVVPAISKGQFHWVLALSDRRLSTPRVYQAFDEMFGEAPPPEVDRAVLRAVRAGDAAALGKAMTNDLQGPALALLPALQPLLNLGPEHGALGQIVSGSGPTCAFLVADEEVAMELAVALSASGLCRAVRRASGPVAGATILSS